MKGWVYTFRGTKFAISQNICIWDALLNHKKAVNEALMIWIFFHRLHWLPGFNMARISTDTSHWKTTRNSLKEFTYNQYSE